jgi:hypothetical protein
MRDVLRRFQRGEITLDEAEAAIEAQEVTPSVPRIGTVVRREAARPSTTLTAIAIGLVALVILFAFLFLWGLVADWAQRPLALLLGAMFFTLGVITDVYRRGFMADKLTVKRRRDKVVPRED